MLVQAIDHAVATAYYPGDLALAHGFRETPQGLRFTISEAGQCEVLGWLLALNHDRSEEEVRAGLHERGRRENEVESAKRAKRQGSR
ncbi:MAG: hypothetical protein M5U01_09200 [Ardenticatenaceae bacterium]|nr:hypothetical protein [Ardenticatenaceae bacterium]